MTNNLQWLSLQNACLCFPSFKADLLPDEEDTANAPPLSEDEPSERMANYAHSSAPSDRYRHQRPRLAPNALQGEVILREQRKRSRVRRHLSISTITHLTNNLQVRSVCSWRYQVNHDITRIPVDLPEALCSNTLVHGSRNRCEQVFYNVPIRRLDTSGTGEAVWTDRWEPMKVGCTLAAPASTPYTMDW